MMKKIKIILVFIAVAVLVFAIFAIPRFITYTKGISSWSKEDFIDKNSEYFDTKEKRAAWWYYLDQEWKECLTINLYLSKGGAKSKIETYKYFLFPSSYISDNRINEILKLKKIEGRKYMTFFPSDYRYNKFSTFKPLDNLTNVVCFKFFNSNIYNLSIFSKHVNMKKLILNNCRMSSLNGIHKFKKLEYLDCSFNSISSLTGLFNIESLDTLIIYRNNLKSSDIRKLRESNIKEVIITENEYLEYKKNN